MGSITKFNNTNLYQKLNIKHHNYFKTNFNNVSPNHVTEIRHIFYTQLEKQFNNTGSSNVHGLHVFVSQTRKLLTSINNPLNYLTLAAPCE